MIAIIDYGAGNLKSVQKAFEFLGFEAVITNQKNIIKSADSVVLPGVGSFGEAMEKLNKSDLVDTISYVIEKGTPFLGICLGMQLIFEKSEESPGVKGLSILKGEIVKIPKVGDLKIPHMGWNSLKINKDCKMFDGLDQDEYVYFVHSYYLKAQDKNIVCATTEYGIELEVGINYKNIFAFQFHPEKSSDVGLTMLKNFAQLKREDFK